MTRRAAFVLREWLFGVLLISWLVVVLLSGWSVEIRWLFTFVWALVSMGRVSLLVVGAGSWIADFTLFSIASMPGLLLLRWLRLLIRSNTISWILDLLPREHHKVKVLLIVGKFEVRSDKRWNVVVWLSKLYWQVMLKSKTFLKVLFLISLSFCYEFMEITTWFEQLCRQ